MTAVDEAQFVTVKFMIAMLLWLLTYPTLLIATIARFVTSEPGESVNTKFSWGYAWYLLCAALCVELVMISIVFVLEEQQAPNRWAFPVLTGLPVYLYVRSFFRQRLPLSGGDDFELQFWELLFFLIYGFLLPFLIFLSLQR